MEKEQDAPIIKTIYYANSNKEKLENESEESNESPLVICASPSTITIESCPKIIYVRVEEKEENNQELTENPTDTSLPGSSNMLTYIGKRKKQFKCDECPKMFEAMCHLNTHKRTHSGEKPFACYLCGYRSARLYDLKTHVITHSGKKRFPCDQCNSSFNQRNNYEKHLKKHLESTSSKTSAPKKRKKHICQTCNEIFLDKKSLLQHVVEHEGRKPFPCDSCGKSFMRQYDLKVHFRIHSGEKPYTCHICQADFRQQSNFYRHLKSHGVRN